MWQRERISTSRTGRDVGPSAQAEMVEGVSGVLQEPFQRGAAHEAGQHQSSRRAHAGRIGESERTASRVVRLGWDAEEASSRQRMRSRGRWTTFGPVMSGQRSPHVTSQRSRLDVYIYKSVRTASGFQRRRRHA